MNSRNTSYRLILLSSLIWCLLIFAAPVAKHLQIPFVADSIYMFFSRICHQLDSHSLHLFDGKLGVCARCSAIYFGFLLSVAIYPLFVRKNLLTTVRNHTDNWATPMVFSIIPLLVDVALDFTGIHTSTLLSRLTTGAFFGFALPFYFLPVADEAFRELRHSISLPFRRKVHHAE